MCMSFQRGISHGMMTIKVIERFQINGTAAIYVYRTPSAKVTSQHDRLPTMQHA
jgi:hypothetical protein